MEERGLELESPTSFPKTVTVKLSLGLIDMQDYFSNSQRHTRLHLFVNVYLISHRAPS